MVAAGWVVSQAVASLAPSGQSVQLGLTGFWLIGSLVSISASFFWMRERTFTWLFPVWTVPGVTGLVASFAVVTEAVGVAPMLVLGSLWFAGPAVGFAVTAFLMNNWSSRLYGVAAAAHVAGAVAVLAVLGVESIYFLIAAATQGLPMLYHGVRLG